MAEGVRQDKLFDFYSSLENHVLNFFIECFLFLINTIRGDTTYYVIEI